ncbi:hypothetical protein C7B67_19525 [filamentous cyanobacterium Phorm 6]|nr:hypothetical protein C7B67_19525 [filamentous cyanobacterium Phorm 6]
MKIEELLQRKGIIHRDPEIMSGVPVFVGTRVPLKTFFDYLEGESGFAEFINDFPYLESQAIKVLENLTKSLQPIFIHPIQNPTSLNYVIR